MSEDQSERLRNLMRLATERSDIMDMWREMSKAMMGGKGRCAGGLREVCGRGGYVRERERETDN